MLWNDFGLSSKRPILINSCCFYEITSLALSSCSLPQSGFQFACWSTISTRNVYTRRRRVKHGKNVQTWLVILLQMAHIEVRFLIKLVSAKHCRESIILQHPFASNNECELRNWKMELEVLPLVKNTKILFDFRIMEYLFALQQ